MKALREQQVAEAIYYLQRMGVAKLFIDAVCQSPSFLQDFYAEAWDCPELANVLKRLEENGSLPYFVTHEEMTFGECYSILTISPYIEDFAYSKPTYIQEMGAFRVYAYVWNVSDDSKSEPGSIYVEVKNKIPYRVA